MGLVLRAVDVAGPHRWRWMLIDQHSGVSLADHLVKLDPRMAETEAFEDLSGFLRRAVDPNNRVTGEVELTRRIGAWIGSRVLGERIGRAIATAAPVTVRVQLPAGAEFLAFRPLELAHIGGVPVAAQGHVALVYDFPSRVRPTRAPVGAALRMLAVFSLATAASATALRRERYEMSRLVRRVAVRGRRRVELAVAPHGLTRAGLAELVDSGDGWDVLHLSGPGEFRLTRPDGSADPVSAPELVELLRPARRRLKLAVVSSHRSTTATVAETLRWLGLSEHAATVEARAAREATPAPRELVRALVTELGCAVVAMRYPVVDEFAAGFAEALYDRLFRNTQPLDRAVAAAVPDALGPAPSSIRPAMSVAAPAIFGASAIKLSLAPPVGKPVGDPAAAAMAWFPPEPPRFAGRVEVMADAGSALAPESGRAAVLFQGMTGAGKTTCAVELAYRYQRCFAGSAFWSAPSDPDQYGDALRLLALSLDAQLGDHGLAMADRIAPLTRLQNFLPALTATLAETGLLLVLDNLETLLTPDGQWRDLRWAPLIGALTGHTGPSRVILTSRIVPAGLDPGTVLVQPVPPLTRDESLLLVRRLPNLRALLHTESEPDRPRPGTVDPALARRALTLTQGHPLLLELADASAADPARLARQLAEVEAAVDGAALDAFLAEGETGLDAEQLRQLCTAWITGTAAPLPAAARLLLQALCRIEETDRSTAILRVNWSGLWQRVDQPGEPAPLGTSLAALVTAGLIATDLIDPADPDGPMRYRIHPGVAEAIGAATPEPVTAAVDAQLATWWTVVGAWGAEQQAGQDTGEILLRAALAAARYLLRQSDWTTAGCLLERALIRDSYAPATALAALPPLRRIAEATGDRTDLVLLAAALRKVDPGEAETLLRRAYEQAVSGGDHRLASITTGDLITLLRDQGRLREALTLADQKIEHTNQAGFGAWTQLSDQGRRLQILGLLGQHERVLDELAGLRARMADLPDQRADNDRVNPWNVREGLLDVGRDSAVALRRWEVALGFTDEVAEVQRCRGAGRYESARARFPSYLPLLRLGRLADADHLLRDCQEAFDTAGDTGQLGAVHAARAELADQRDHHQAAVDLQRAALRLRYLRADPREIATAHHRLADYLAAAAGNPAEQRAHRLTAALLGHLVGDTRDLTRTLGVLAGELGGDAEGPRAPVLPSTLPELIRLVDAGDGVRFGDLVRTLCPDPATAKHALADLLATATTATSPAATATALTTTVTTTTVTTVADQRTGRAAVGPEALLAAWEPIITAIGAAATDGDTPAELTGLLDDIAGTDWAALVVALHRVLAGERSPERLRIGLDTVGTAILTATLDRLRDAPGAGC